MTWNCSSSSSSLSDGRRETTSPLSKEPLPTMSPGASTSSTSGSSCEGGVLGVVGMGLSWAGSLVGS